VQTNQLAVHSFGSPAAGNAKDEVRLRADRFNNDACGLLTQVFVSGFDDNVHTIKRARRLPELTIRELAQKPQIKVGRSICATAVPGRRAGEIPRYLSPAVTSNPLI